MLRSSSEEIAAVSSSSEMLGGREEITLNRVVCLIKVNGIHFNICLLQTLKRVVSGENQFVTLSLIDPVTNLISAGGTLVMSLTAVNVKHRGVSNELKKLRRELLSKQNARSNYNDSLSGFFQKLANSIKNSNVGLATASRNNNLTLRILSKGGESTFLVRAKLNHRSHRVCEYYTAQNRGLEGPL